RGIQVRLRRAVGIGAGPGEMRMVQPPERLYAGIEGAAGQRVEPPALLEQVNQFARWRFQNATAVQDHERRILPVKTEDRFQSLQVLDDKRNRLFRRGLVMMVDPYGRFRAERDAAPGNQMHFGARPRREWQQAQTCRSGGDADEAPPADACRRRISAHGPAAGRDGWRNAARLLRNPAHSRAARRKK